MRAERSRHVVLVTPPAVERAGAEVWGLVFPGLAPGVSRIGPSAVVVCADYEQATQWAAAAPAELRVHAVTGLARSAVLLKEGRVGLLAGAAADVAALVSRAALKLATLDTIILAWPETFAESLDTLLAEAPEARRVVLSWNPAALQDFLDRHARRAEVIGIPATAPVAAARYAVRASVPEAIDALNALHPLIWRGGPIAPPSDGCDAVIAAVLPSPQELAELARLGEPVVLVTAAQLPYLRSIASPLALLRLPAAADRARDRADGLRARISELIETGQVDAELALLDPLFERFDAAEVAAALLAISRQPSAVSPLPTAPGWVKVFVNVGKKDRAGAKDLVGALIREVGLDKAQIGRIDVRDTFSLVELSADAAQRAMGGLSGVTIRGRRVVARLERP